MFSIQQNRLDQNLMFVNNFDSMQLHENEKIWAIIGQDKSTISQQRVESYINK